MLRRGERAPAAAEVSIAAELRECEREIRRLRGASRPITSCLRELDGLQRRVAACQARLQEALETLAERRTTRQVVRAGASPAAAAPAAVRPLAVRPLAVAPAAVPFAGCPAPLLVAPATTAPILTQVQPATNLPAHWLRGC